MSIVGGIFAKPDYGRGKRVIMLRGVSTINLWAEDLSAATLWYIELLASNSTSLTRPPGAGRATSSSASAITSKSWASSTGDSPRPSLPQALAGRSSTGTSRQCNLRGSERLKRRFMAPSRRTRRSVRQLIEPKQVRRTQANAALRLTPITRVLFDGRPDPESLCAQSAPADAVLGPAILRLRGRSRCRVP